MATGIQCIIQEAEKAKSLAADSEGVPESVLHSTARVHRLLGDFRGYVGRMASPSSPEINNIVSFTQTNDWEEFGKANNADTLTARMITGHEEAMLLKMLVSMSGATRVLEIGMFTGCAALAMAEAIPSHGTVVTCDIQPALKKVVRNLVDKSPHGKKIEIRIGPALESLEALRGEGRQFDFVFIDADKTNYINYYKFLLDKDLLAPGGTICCDNVLYAGNAFLPHDERYPPDSPNCHAIPAFNEEVSKDDRVYNVMLPNRDGIFLIRRKTDVNHS